MPSSPVSLWGIFLAFAKIGATSFGGGIVAYLRDALVEEHQWVDDDEFLAALEIGQTLPGLNATNIAVIVGRKLHGAPGATAAALGMLLPGTLAVMVLGVLNIFALLSLLAVGGGTAVLPQMKQETVNIHHWVDDEQFTTIYSLGQLAPGPNI